MRVSQYYELAKSQAELPFVDVDVSGDVRLYLDPRALLLYRSRWGEECVSLLQDFFGEVLAQLNSGTSPAQLLSELHEPNEIRLGQSRGRARGRGIGASLADDVARALSTSAAARTGLLQDLEDTILMIEDVGPDMISDITANVVREPLIRYTQEMIDEYGMTSEDDLFIGPIWSPGQKTWIARFDRALYADERPLLLVPKGVVRRRLDFDPDEYYRHHILPELRSQELDAGGELVHVLKNGKSRVTAEDLRAKYGHDKHLIERVTVSKPTLLAEYRAEKTENPSSPMTHETLASYAGSADPDWAGLLRGMRDIPRGHQASDDYVDAIKGLLTALFYPALVDPRKEVRIHAGRKRVDLSFSNLARSGFFGWLANHYPAANIFIECKNYLGDPANPELDQLSGRFSPSRGRVGILVCRTIADRALFERRCRDTANDNRGFIIPLDDDDLAELVGARTQDPAAELPGLRERFDRLIM